MRNWAIVALAATLGACEGGTDGGTISIPSGTWAMFQQYKNHLRPNDDRYFAASWDGGWASNNDKSEVLKSCQEYAESTCVLFAHNDQILLPYRVRN